MKWTRKFGWWLRRQEREDALRHELEFHMSEEIDERRANGIAPDHAQWAARRDIGNVTLLSEEARTLWTWTPLEQFVQDLRFATRTMLRSRTFTVMAALSLALGIGANTAIYGFMDAILLRALPVEDPASLVVVKWHSQQIAFGRRAAPGSAFVVHSIDGQMYDEGTGSTARIFPFPAFERLRDAATPVMSSLFAYRPAGRLNVVARGQADVVRGEYVSGDFFGGVGVLPMAGRPILSDDDRPGAPPVAVLSFGYARRRFSEADAAVNQSIRVNNVAFTVVGVAPPEFFGVDPSAAPDVYLPLHTGEVSPDPNSYWLEMMGRLRPGVDAERAQTVLRATFQPWVATTAENDAERANLPRLRLDPGAGGLDTLRRRYSKPLYVLLAMVGLILAIACANTANLLLARATARRREMAVRLSVGAGRGRIVRQLLTESVCLACLSGALAVPIALTSMRLLTVLLANGQESFTLHAELNWHVLLVTFGLSVVCGVLFGLAPALQSTHPELMPALKDGNTGDRVIRRWGGRGRPTVTQGLVIAQIAISVLLLVGAGLFVRTLANLESIPLGFNPNRVMLFDVNARQAGHSPAEIAGFYADLRRRLTMIPGVTDVTMSHASLIRAGRSLPIVVSGKEATDARILQVGPAFFTTMGIRLLHGREIEERDESGAQAVAVVSELFARNFLGNTSAVGHHFVVDQPVQVDGPVQSGGPMDFEIIGVAAAARYGDLRDRIPPVAYLPYGSLKRPPIAQMTFAMRTMTDARLSLNAIRAIVHDADPQLPLTNARTQTVEIDQTINQEIVFARLCSTFAVLALVIACVGLYGTMAYAVARRTTEIGIRMALGAKRTTVAWLVLREVCVLAVLGLSLSLPIALATSRFVESFLFNLKPNDPYALSSAVIILIVAALVAGYGPAHRAARISPMTALRAD